MEESNSKEAQAFKQYAVPIICFQHYLLRALGACACTFSRLLSATHYSQCAATILTPLGALCTIETVPVKPRALSQVALAELAPGCYALPVECKAMLFPLLTNNY